MITDLLYANVGPDGLIVFEKGPDRALWRLPVLIGEPRAVMRTIRRWASLHSDGVTYWLPKLAAVQHDQQKGASITADYLKFFTERMEAEEQAK